MVKRKITRTALTTVCCWVYGDDKKNVFTIKIAKHALIAELKQSIRECINEFENIPAKDLCLYTVPDLESCVALHEGARLDSAAAVNDLTDCVIIVDGPRPMTLYYWVYGDLLSQIAWVEVFGKDTVGKLKSTIISDNTDFTSSSARDLALYPIPPEKNGLNLSLSCLLESLTISAMKPLGVRQSVSECFPTFNPDSLLHLVVVVATRVVPVEYWIRGSDNLDPFKIMAPPRSTVGDLKYLIKGTNEAAAGNIDLFRISALEKDNLAEVLGDAASGASLKGACKLWSIFEAMALTESLYVVVQDRVISEKAKKPPPPIHHDIKTDHPIAIARTKYLKSIPSQSPSRTGAPSSFRTRQRAIGKAVACGRPNSIEDAIPPTLLHPIFGRFVDDCQNTQPTFKDNLFTDDVGKAMSAIYDNEAERVRKVSEVFASYDIPFDLADKGPYPTDSSLCVNKHRYVIAEYKNEAGSTSSEPFFQAIGYYVESTRETAIAHFEDTLPCLLVTLSGSTIEFSAAVWNLRPSIQLLTDPISFKYYSTDTTIQPFVARRLVAFRKAILRLKNYYEKLQATCPNIPLDQPHLFPYPTSYRSHQTESTFRYIEHLDTGKLIFKGRQGDGDTFVKFTRSYSPTVHKFFENEQCAPALRGLMKVPGGWFMVIMDLLEGYTMLHQCTSIHRSVLHDIGAMLDLLHTAGYVHGDIRDPNIMVSNKDGNKFMFVDFDWAGKVGKARYPVGINFTEIVRPVGARDGKLIKVADDRFMFCRLRGQPPAEENEHAEGEGELEVEFEDVLEDCLGGVES